MPNIIELDLKFFISSEIELNNKSVFKLLSKLSKFESKLKSINLYDLS